MKKITVFCGSSAGKDPKFKKTAFQLGKTLAKKEIGVVYGGGRVGLMGAVADGAMKHKGTVIGIIPIFLATKEIAHHGLTELIVVDTMHERKMLMSELCDGVIALPGGFGTMEELFEMLTWTQLGLHQKPVGLLNTNGYFDGLLSFIQKMVDQGFLKKVNQEMLLVDKTIGALLKKMNKYVAPNVKKWIAEEQV